MEGLQSMGLPRLVFNCFIQLASLAGLYSQFQLSLRSDPIAFGVSTSTYIGLVMVHYARHLPYILRKMK